VYQTVQYIIRSGLMF